MRSNVRYFDRPNIRSNSKSLHEVGHLPMENRFEWPPIGWKVCEIQLQNQRKTTIKISWWIKKDEVFFDDVSNVECFIRYTWISLTIRNYTTNKWTDKQSHQRSRSEKMPLKILQNNGKYSMCAILNKINIFGVQSACKSDNCRYINETCVLLLLLQNCNKETDIQIPTNQPTNDRIRIHIISTVSNEWRGRKKFAMRNKTK